MKLFSSVLATLSVASVVLGQSTSVRPSQSSSGGGGSSQSQGPSGSAGTTAAPQPSVSTSFSMQLSLSGPSRAQVSVSVPIPITIQPAATAATTAAGGSVPPGSAGGTATTSSTPTTYPFATSTVDVGAQGGPVAPSPGSSSNPAMGPDDNYIAGARQLAVGGVTLALGLGMAIVVQQLA